MLELQKLKISLQMLELTNKVAEKIVGVVAGESTVTFKANGGRFAR